MEFEQLAATLRFIVEADRLKSIERITRLTHCDRRENSAEHSWHVALMAIVLHHHANDDIDLLRTIEMLVLHDLVEIYAGDTFLHSPERNSKHRRMAETEAARSLFALLPASLGGELRQLWEEFRNRHTPEARFAEAIDRLQPLLHNYANDGGDWVEFGLTKGEVLAKNEHIREGSERLWEYTAGLLEDAAERGMFAGSG